MEVINIRQKGGNKESKTLTFPKGKNDSSSMNFTISDIYNISQGGLRKRFLKNQKRILARIQEGYERGFNHNAFLKSLLQQYIHKV